MEHNGLREMNFGEYEGKLLEESRDGYREINDAWADGNVGRHWPGGGESPVEVAARARAAMRDLGLLGFNSERGIRRIALVTHGRFNKIFLSSLLGRGISTCGTIKQDNCCINVIDIDPCAPLDSTTACTEVVLNYCEHLTEAAATAAEPALSRSGPS